MGSKRHLNRCIGEGLFGFFFHSLFTKNNSLNMKNLTFKFYFIYLLIIGVCQAQVSLDNLVEDSTMMTFEPDEYQTTIG